MKTLNHIPSLKTAILLIATITTTLLAKNKEAITHSFLGVGIGEATAIIVRGKRFAVMGENSVIVIDLRAAKLGRPVKGKL